MANENIMSVCLSYILYIHTLYLTSRIVHGTVGMLSGSTGRVNGETRLSFTILLITSLFPRQVDGSD